MPENATGDAGNTTAPQDNTGPHSDPQPTDNDKAFTPPASQADFDRIIEQRLQLERSKFSGFDDFKAKAEQFDQLQDANKTELEKASARAEQAERALADAQTAQLRTEVALAKQVPADLAGRLVGATREELEADADALLSHLAPKQPEPVEQAGPFTLNLGDATHGGNAAPINDAAARSFFGI